MCSHYKLPASPLGWGTLLDSAFPEEELGDVSRLDGGGASATSEGRDAHPTDLVPAILRDPDSGLVVAREMRFGLLPPWLREGSGASTFNARAETLAERPVFREAFRGRRCILPMPEFYEGRGAEKVAISLVDGVPMGVAGLWESKPGPEGPILSCALITCAPNELVATIHERMPAILPVEEWREWLDPALKHPIALDRFLRPYAADRMVMRKAEPFRRAARKASVETDDQGSLF